MDNNKKAILKLYDMIRDLQDEIDDLNEQYEFRHTTRDTCNDLKKLGFNKEEVKEILELDSGFTLGLQILDEVFKGEE